jgi:sugar-specific transcriptional regulator TrmB
MKSCQVKASKSTCDISAYRSTDPRTSLIAFFQDLGLKPNEQKLLAALIVTKEDAGVDELSKMTGVRHDEVYENLSNLGREGLVSCAFSSHRRFVAPSFSNIVDQLLSAEYDQLTSLKNKSGHYQKLIEEIRSKNKRETSARTGDKIRMLAGRQRLESKITEMAETTSKSFSLVITEKAFRGLAHGAVFFAIASLSGRKVNLEIVVPSESIADCLRERGSEIRPRVVEKMSADSVSFAIADGSEILVIPTVSETRLCGICSTNISFIASFASYLQKMLERAVIVS